MADELDANIKTSIVKNLETPKSDDGDVSSQRKSEPPFWFQLIAVFTFAILIAFISNKKDDRVAKSVCHVKDIDQNCLSLSSYNLDLLKNGENSDTAGFGAKCRERGWEVKIFPAIDSVRFECVKTNCVTS